MKTVNFEQVISTKRNDNFKDPYALVFDSNSIQDSNEICHYPEVVGEPLRLELNNTSPLEHGAELIVWDERMSSVAVDTFGVVGKKM